MTAVDGHGADGGGWVVEPTRPVSTVRAEPGRPPWAWILGCWAGLAVLVTSVAIWAIGDRAPTNVNVGTRFWLDAWLVDDARWYQSIAADGYFYLPGQQSSIAFFPSYPMTVRGVGWVLGSDFQLAAWLVALAAGLAAVVMFTGWVWARLPGPPPSPRSRCSCSTRTRSSCTAR